MSKITSETPDRPDKDEPTSITRMADVQKSDAHVSQLLHIAEQCSKYLWRRTETGETLEVDDALIVESRKTLALTHVRLRDLIDEQRRWTLDPTQHEKEAAKLIDSTMELYGQKTINAKIYNRPSIFLRPQIAKFPEGWFVWLGGSVPTSRDLHGKGDAPALAAKAFDEAYYDLKEAIEKQPPQPVPPAPKRASRKPRKA